MEKFELLEYVVNKREFGLRPRDCLCPYCNSQNHQSTVKFSTATILPHSTDTRMCNGCGKFFYINDKGANTWISDKDGKLLLGIPNCYEDYIYTCKCGGNVRRSYLDKEGNKCKSLHTAWNYETSKYEKQYITRWNCDSCDLNITTEADYAR